MNSISNQEIEKNAKLFCDVSDKIWEYAELSLKEFKSAELYCKVLAENGFKVEKDLAGIKTCFKASFGQGKPYIGILAEFDALSGLSQEGGKAEKAPINTCKNGHGCGHNILGAGSLAAVFGIKKYLEEKKCEGTVIFFGCPGEEGGAGKAFMARENMWRELDVALTWHPDDQNKVWSGTCISCIQKQYTFKGIASHASGSPELGRSALDAVELMNIGVQFLREHMKSTAKIHYAITDAGGNSPNVVQPLAKVLYMVRDVQVQSAIELQKRVDKIAEAAAMMTETKLSVQFIDGTANIVPNKTLEELLYQCMQKEQPPKFDENEIAFAQKLVDSYEMKPQKLQDIESKNDAQKYDFLLKATNDGKKPLNDFVTPYTHSYDVMSGSTDVGDVSWQTPTAQIFTTCFSAGVAGHSWQNVSIGNTSIAHKGLLYAGKILAAAAIELLEKPEIIEKAKADFAIAAKDGYTCPIPKDAVPVAI